VTHPWLVRNRLLLDRFGVEHRETLVVEHMTRHHLTQRPLLKNIWRELMRISKEYRSSTSLCRWTALRKPSW